MNTTTTTHAPGARVWHPLHGAGTVVERHPTVPSTVGVLFDTPPPSPAYFFFVERLTPLPTCE
jgi:hypothetical protein